MPGAVAAAIDVQYDALLREMVDSVHRICRIVLRGDPHAADDAAGAALEKLVREAPPDDLRDHRAWLRRVAKNAAIDEARKLARRREQEDSRDLADAFAVTDSAPTPETRALEDELRGALRDQIARLTPAQRQVIELRLEGLTGNEIAAALGQTRQWVDVNAWRAKERLRQFILSEGAES